MKVPVAKKHIINAYHKGIAPFLWGSPGIGKSSVVHQSAKELGIDLIDVRLAQLEPTDLRGIPVPNHTTKRTESYYPDWLPKSGKGILFLDELEKAPIAVKNAALQLVLDRKIGSYTLPNGWGIVGAGNREDDGCYSQPLGAALANRLIHFKVEADYDSWLEWARNNNINDGILGYLAFRRDHLLYYTSGDNAFPSPRSWEMLNTMLRDVESPLEQRDLFEATVGEVVGLEYRTWYTVYKNVKVEDIVLEGKLPDFNKAEKGKEKSFEYAVTMAVAHYVKNMRDNTHALENIAKFLEFLNPELRLVFTKQIPSSKLARMIEHKAFNKIANRLIEIILGGGNS